MTTSAPVPLSTMAAGISLSAIIPALPPVCPPRTVAQSYFAHTIRGETVPSISNSIAHFLYFAQGETRTTLTEAITDILHNIHIGVGDECTINLPDGSVLSVKSGGHWSIDQGGHRQTFVGALFSNMRIELGDETTISLPDGTVLDVSETGSYTINDNNAKTIYKGHAAREFNSYLNASDKLEDFIKFCAAQGVRQQEMLHLPVNLFIAWLIIEASHQDDVDPPQIDIDRDVRAHTAPRCGCGKFISRDRKARGINFCSVACFEAEFNK